MPGDYTVVLRVTDAGGNTAELSVPLEIIGPVEDNGTGNETDPEGDDEATYILRKEMNENLVKLFWIFFAVMVIIVITYDVTVNIKGLHVEKEMDYYYLKRGKKRPLRKKKDS